MIDREIEIRTRDGVMSTFVTHPERDGPHPLVLFYMDAPGIREELRDMARRLGSAGYYVMLPNLYYRSGVMELGPLPADPNAPERQRMFQLMESLSISLVMSDTEALMAFASKDPAAKSGATGAVGYCMSGQYAMNAVVRFPERVKAAASIHGIRLVTDSGDSPHLVARCAGAEIYVACAETDRWMSLEQVEDLRGKCAGAAASVEIELFPETEHGFVFPGRAVYHKTSAERHWERLHSLFGRNLR
jgi:carboxymethylenebutenolidase